MTTDTGTPETTPGTPATGKTDYVLQIKGLRTHFGTIDGIVKAVDGVSFEIKRGHTLGVVGESGCG